jgi:hypothetical protein
MTKMVGESDWLVAEVGHSGAYLPVRSRCLHPGQQQGRRWPSSSSSWVRRMRRSRVISCLASSTQQMNSLRARGVMSFQASSAVGLAISALRRSPGSLCTTPPGTRGLLTGPRYWPAGAPSPARSTRWRPRAHPAVPGRGRADGPGAHRHVVAPGDGLRPLRVPGAGRAGPRRSAPAGRRPARTASDLVGVGGVRRFPGGAASPALEQEWKERRREAASRRRAPEAPGPHREGRTR